MSRILTILLALLVMATSAFAQSQAINGTIEGTIFDDQNSVLPGVTVTVVNTGTGDTRVVVTNDSGLFRALLLPLGSYRVSAELQGFRTYEQSWIVLTAGQSAVINIKMTVGAVQETITVTADSPIVNLGRIEQGRTLTEAEVKNLPLTSRNPYNFALLQPGVVGFENQEFGVPRITANGAEHTRRRKLLMPAVHRTAMTHYQAVFADTFERSRFADRSATATSIWRACRLPTRRKRSTR